MNPDLVALNVGTNDLKSDKPPDEAAFDIIKLAALINNREIK